jgi:hypothetical protein
MLNDTLDYIGLNDGKPDEFGKDGNGSVCGLLSLFVRAFSYRD